MNKGYCMDESKKQTLEKTFKDIRKEEKNNFRNSSFYSEFYTRLGIRFYEEWLSGKYY